MQLAPIVIFAYNRRIHLERLVESLKMDPLAVHSNVFIFVDGPKGSKDIAQVEAVRSYVMDVCKSGIFGDCHAEICGTNKGLAETIIRGVDSIISKYDKVIVIEDDVVVADRFLEFMNDALEYYKDDSRIWSVGGFSFIRDFPTGYNQDVFFAQRSSSYAWACWRDRWDRIDWDVSDYSSFRYNLKARHSFNQWGQDRAMMLDSQQRGKINSWAIRFDYSMWKHNMYNVFPCESRCKSTGHDGTGTNSPRETKDPFEVECHKLDERIKMCDFILNREIKMRFRSFFKVSGLRRLKRYLTI